MARLCGVLPLHAMVEAGTVVRGHSWGGAAPHVYLARALSSVAGVEQHGGGGIISPVACEEEECHAPAHLLW